MYGQIHIIIKDMVIEKFGIDAWKSVLMKSQMGDNDFRQFDTYPDKVTTGLMNAVADVTNKRLYDTLKEIGKYFPQWLMTHGFEKMMTSLAGDLVSFIENLDSLHSLLTFSFKNMTAPSFRCVPEDNSSLILHYYSSRTGLYPMVIGMLQTVSTKLYNEECSITFLSENQEDMGQRTVMNHAQFRIRVDHKMPGLVTRHPSRNNVTLSQDLTSVDPGTPSVIRPDDFNAAFPYHLQMDRSLNIQDCGTNIRILAVKAFVPGTPFSELATILYPKVAPTIQNIFSFINTKFVIGLLRPAGHKPFSMQGQMMWLPHCARMLFMGSPKVSRLDDFRDMTLFLCDVPAYDATRELALVNQQRSEESDVLRKAEEGTTEIQHLARELGQKKKRTEEVLHQMLPRKIAAQLTAGLSVESETFERCTMLFSDIVTFAEIVHNCTADDIVKMLDDIYHRFDLHTDPHDVYKVETIEDAYMAVTGVPEAQEEHAERMAEFAMDMQEEASNVKSPITGQPLKIRVGMHSGAVVTGVIGKRRPRYDVYGDTVNTASRMMSHGAGGRIHTSNATFSLLYSHGYKFRARGEIVVKGKGCLKTYFLIGNVHRQLVEPDDTFCNLHKIQHPHPVLRSKNLRAGTAPVPKKSPVRKSTTDRNAVTLDSITQLTELIDADSCPNSVADEASVSSVDPSSSSFTCSSQLETEIFPTPSPLIPSTPASPSTGPLSPLFFAITSPAVRALTSTVPPQSSTLSSTRSPKSSVLSSIVSPKFSVPSSAVSPKSSVFSSTVSPKFSVPSSAVASRSFVPSSAVAPPPSVPSSAVSPPSSVPSSAVSPPSSVPSSAVSPPSSVPSSAVSPPSSVPSSAMAPRSSVRFSAMAPRSSIPSSAVSPPSSIPSSAVSPPSSVPSSAVSPPSSVRFSAMAPRSSIPSYSVAPRSTLANAPPPSCSPTAPRPLSSSSPPPPNPPPSLSSSQPLHRPPPRQLDENTSASVPSSSSSSFLTPTFSPSCPPPPPSSPISLSYSRPPPKLQDLNTSVVVIEPSSGYDTLSTLPTSPPPRQRDVNTCCASDVSLPSACCPSSPISHASPSLLSLHLSPSKLQDVNVNTCLSVEPQPSSPASHFHPSPSPLPFVPSPKEKEKKEKKKKKGLKNCAIV